MGDTKSVLSDLLELHIEKCIGEGCREEKEIQTFLQDIELAFVMNDNNFNRENYNDLETVKSVPRLFLLDLPTDLQT